MGDKVRVQEFNALSQELRENIGLIESVCKFGDTGYTLPITYKDDADSCRSMAVRPDDVWVVSFPRSGTTWTQELVWLLMNDLDYDTAAKIPLVGRYTFLEKKHIILDMPKEESLIPDTATMQEMAKTMRSYETVNAPSPRFIKTHLPLSLLPANLLDIAKVVYVARNLRDVVVSYYYFSRSFMKYAGDFKQLWNIFNKDLVLYTPFFSHVKEAWALRHHPNVLFIFYEDMAMDLPSCIKRIANFFGKEVTNEQIVQLCEHLDIKNFRNNISVNLTPQLNRPDNGGFVRKGGVGGWREYFDAEMTAQAEAWLRENLADTDLRFRDTIQ